MVCTLPLNLQAWIIIVQTRHQLESWQLYVTHMSVETGLKGAHVLITENICDWIPLHYLLMQDVWGTCGMSQSIVHELLKEGANVSYCARIVTTTEKDNPAAACPGTFGLPGSYEYSGQCDLARARPV